MFAFFVYITVRNKFEDRIFNMKKFKKIMKWFSIISLLTFFGLSMCLLSLDQVGTIPDRARLEKLADTNIYKDGKFSNIEETTVMGGNILKAGYKFLTGKHPYVKPEKVIPIVKLSKSDFPEKPNDKFSVKWLGHSSLLIEIEGKRYLTDPVFGDYTTPIMYMGPKRFFPPPAEVEDLPKLDGIIISHNHYDHLDYGTIRKFAKTDVKFFVSLGLMETLVDWGIDSSRIIERTWWESVQDGNIELINTPARHFSGRKIIDNNKTQWGSWVIKGEKYRIFFSGDSGPTEDFQDIGDKYGPFDLAFIEIGAYDEYWPDIHMGPENAVKMLRKLRCTNFIPIHWGTFDLALHSWYDPVVRLSKAVRDTDIRIRIPRPGETVNYDEFGKIDYWWLEVCGFEI